MNERSRLLSLSLRERLGEGQMAWIWLESGLDDRLADDAYRRAVTHLRRTIGDPLDDPFPNGEKEPVLDRIVIWNAAAADIGLHLSAGPEFADYASKCAISVEPKTTRKPSSG